MKQAVVVVVAVGLFAVSASRTETAAAGVSVSLGSIGDACSLSGFVCAVDMKNALICVGGKLVLAETCKGPNGCKIGGSSSGSIDIFCDNDISDIGDPCRDEGDYACTGDKIAALRCTGHRMAMINTCRGSRSCSVVHPSPKQTDIDCDMSVAQRTTRVRFRATKHARWAARGC